MLSLTLPIPPSSLSPNARVHRMAKAKATREARRHSFLVARGATGGRRLMVSVARTLATFWWPSKRRRDRDNATGMLKAYMDGLTDAGIWVDDSVVTHLPPVMELDPTNPRVEIQIFFDEPPQGN